MTNHVHLLVTPQERGAVGLMMQDVGRRFVRAVNESTGRTGTLWEGRYKSCLVDSEHYLLTCYRYIELNPVRAGMVADPAGYEWSSYSGNTGTTGDPVLDPHPVFTRLGRNDEERWKRYRQLVAEGVSGEQLARFRLVTQRQRAFGSDEFVAEIEKRTGQRAGLGTPGPRKAVVAVEKVV